MPNPRTRTNLSPRLDYQVTPTNTLSVRYQYWRNNEVNDLPGSGGFNLASLATNSLDTENTLQATDTQTIGPSTINETRFQYIHETASGNPSQHHSGDQRRGSRLTRAAAPAGSTATRRTATKCKTSLTITTASTPGKSAAVCATRQTPPHPTPVSTEPIRSAPASIQPCPVATLPILPALVPRLSGIAAYQITLKGSRREYLPKIWLRPSQTAAGPATTL